MNWDALGAIAELLGAIAVFATLAYLTVQIRQSAKALELQNQFSAAQIMQARTDTLISMTTTLLSHPDNVSVLERMEPDNFDPQIFENEQLRTRAPLLMGITRANLENIFEQYQQGFLTKDFYEGAPCSNLRRYGPALLAYSVPMSATFEAEIRRVIQAAN